MSGIEMVNIIANSNLDLHNQKEERSILDLALNMAKQNGGRYVCPWKSNCFRLTEKQINFIENKMQAFFLKYSKKPKFGALINSKYMEVSISIYQKQNNPHKFLSIYYVDCGY
jgi:hypothetical protein